MSDQLWTVPNVLSLSRVPLGVILFVCIEWAWWPTALGVFAVAAVTDWLDGWWARRYQQTSLIGRNLDPLTDKFLICGAFIFLIPVDELGVRPWMVTIIVGREVLITGIRGIVEATGAKFGADWFGKLKTVLQCVLLIGLLGVQSWRVTVAEPPAGVVWVVHLLLYATLFATLGSGVQYLVKAAKVLR